MNDLGAGVFQAHLDVSRETLAELSRFEELLRKWNRKINLVSASSLETLWERHFLDSAQLWELSPKSGKWVDLGSGGGFPGLVVAILARDNSDVTFTLVEADQRKAAFLRNAARKLKLNVEVHANRIEALDAQYADILSARALAPLSKLLPYAELHLKLDGLALFPKGETAEDELSEVLETWRFDCQKHPSMTDARSTILSFGEISRV